MLRTRDAAQGRWQSVLSSLGLSDEHLSGKHTACPLECGGRKSFRFDNKRGEGTWICTHCGAGDGVSLAAKFLGTQPAAAMKRIDQIVGNATEDRKIVTRTDDAKIANLRAVWGAALPLHGTDAMRYLTQRMRHSFDLRLTNDLRFHPGLRHRSEDGVVTGPWPAMVALVRDPSGAGVSIHRTYLSGDGKAPVDNAKKLMEGKPIAGGAIRLMPAGRVLGVAEGIETALAASLLHDIPVWSVVSTSGMESFEPPVGVEEVTIFADNDENFAGHKAAYTLAHKLATRRKIKVTVLIPTAGDWADEQAGRWE